MTTLSDLVLTAPIATHGCPTAIDTGDPGVWRIVVEVADPAAGVGVVWHDITDHVAGWSNQRGADQYAGRYRASVVDLDLYAPDDRLAPWNDDTSSTFGVHVDLGPGLIMRGGFIRVSGGTVAEWRPRWTNRVERWGDACYSKGRIRRHQIVARDLLTALVNVPIAASSTESWLDRIAYILTQAGWPFGSIGYGATFLPGMVSVLDIPGRPAANSALDELAATADPAGVVYYTDRRGALIIRPTVQDTFHADAFGAGAAGDPYPAPDPVIFHYLAEDDAFRVLGHAAYAIDSPGVEPFGFDETEAGVINHVVIDGPLGTFDDDDAISIQRYDRKTFQASWIVDNDQVAADLLAYRANAIVEARPLYTTIDNHGFFPGPAGADFLDQVDVVHQTAEGRDVATGTGYVRHYLERCSPRGDGGQDSTWDLAITVDITTVTSTDALLLPVEDLAVVDVGEDYGTFSWTNPTQVVTPTHTQYRLLNSASLWATDAYPITGLTWGALEPDTSYQFQVRLLRIVDGVITHQSPSRSVSFRTDPATVPVVDDDDVVTFPDPPCGTLDWELQESSDGTTWATVDSGTISAPPFTVDLSGYAFNPARLYRILQDACGVTNTSNLFNGECSEPPALGTAPYDDADLIAYWPGICPPDDIVEALSESRAMVGPTFDTFVLDAAHNIVLVGDGQGLMAYGITPGPSLAGSSDATIACRVLISHQPTAPVTLFAYEDITIAAVAEGAVWTVRAFVNEVGAGFTTVTSGDDLVFGSWYDLAVVHDVAAGDLICYISHGTDPTTIGASILGTVGARNTPGSFAIGGPDDTLITNCAVWDRVLAIDELPGFVPPAVPVTINQKAGQSDPATGTPILFEAVFAEAVTGFVGTDVALSGTAGATVAAVSTLDNITYTIAVSGMTGSGTVIANIPAGVCVSVAAGTPNQASTSTDNTVTYNAYSPVTGIPWHICYWADGPEFVAVGLTNGQNVGGFPDEIGTFNAGSPGVGGSTSTPVLVTSDANFNNHRSVQWVNDNDRHLNLTSTDHTDAARSQPYALVVIGKFDSLSNNQTLIDGGSTSNRALIRLQTTDDWAYYAGGTVRQGGTWDTNPHCFMAYFNGASSRLEVDGSTILSGSSPGTDTWDGLRLGYGAGASTSPFRFNGRMTFVGIYYGDPETDGGWANFKSWIGTYYGITVA